MRKIINISSVFFAGIILFSCTPSPKYLREKQSELGYDTNYIRVLIATENRKFNILAKDGIKISDKNNNRIIYETRKSGLIFYPEKISTPYIVESAGSPIFINDRGYRGKIELHNVLGKIHIVNVLNVEEYLYSVIPSEMPASWNNEALKAQAVASRTYTYYHLIKENKNKSIYDIDSTTNFQIYKGIESETPASTKAVQETAGIIMTYNHEPILAYFHSSSGGKTIDPKYVWKGSDLPYIRGVKCAYDKESPHYNWTVTLTIEEINDAFKKKYARMGKIKSITFKRYDGRVIEVSITHTDGNITVSGNDFRLLFPSSKIRSTFFTSERRGNSFILNGKGWGHGVGMSQWGAKGRGENGQSYKDILNHYYYKIKFTKITNNYVAQEKGSVNLVN
jgi:stage II sporulation protein D